MSTEIASLGLAVDSRQVKTAARDLNTLQRSADAASTAATSLAKASDTAAKAHQGMSAQGQAAFHSIRSLGEALAAGQPLTTAFAMQVNHLAFAASGPSGLSGAFKQAGSALLGLASPMTLVAGGLAAVAAAGVLAVNSIAQTEKAFDDTSRAAGTTISHLHDLAAAASFKGIASPDFLQAMDKFAGSVYDAQNHMGGLAEVFRANNATAKDFNGYLEKAADLIKNASSDQQRLQLLQQMGLPATMDWVRFLSQGKEGLRAAIDEATKFGDTADTALIAKARKFDEEWAKAAKNLGTGLKSAIVESVSWLDTLNGKVNALLMKAGVNVGKNVLGDAFNGGPTAANKLTAGSDVSDFYKGLGTGAPGNAVQATADPNRQKNDIARAQQQIAMLGQLASVDDQVRAKELELSAAYLATGVSIGKSRDAVLNLVRAQAEMSRVQEQASIGVFSLRDATKAAGDQLQSWIDRKLIDPSNLEQMAAASNAAKKSIEGIADAAKVAGSALPQFQSALNDASSARKQLDGLATEAMSVNRGLFVEFGQQLRQGASAWEAFKSAGLNALGKLADKLMQMAADNLFAKAFGGGGLLSLFGGGGGGGTMSIAGDLGAGTGGLSFPMFASGTNSAPGGLSIVGEKGPELVNLPRGAQVFNAGQTQGMLSGAGGGQPVVMNDNRQINIGEGASAETVAQLREELARDRASRYADTVRIVQDAKQKRKLK